MATLRMPAEWAPQKRIWLSWPHNEADWPGKFAPVPYVFAEMVSERLSRALITRSISGVPSSE